MRANFCELRYARHLSRYLVPWPSMTARSRQWKASYALEIYIAVWVIVLAWKAGLHVLGGSVPIGVAVLITDTVLLMAILFARGGSGSITPRDLGLCRTPGARSVGYVLVALLTLVFFDQLSAWILPSTSVNQFKGMSNQSVLNIILAGFAACCSAPVIEELFFRGFIYRSLRNRFPVFTAAPIAGIMFGVVHVGSYPLASLPPKAFFGIIACLLYERVGSLLPGIFLHSLIDSGSFELAISGAVRFVLIVAAIVAAGLLLGPVVRACRRFVSGEPILREYRSTGELIVT